MLSLLISSASLLLAAGFKALAESCAHGKSRWSKRDDDFFGPDSWMRKWASNQYVNRILAPNTYYYKLFNLKYKERFPGSATVFVAFTDCYHASFSLMTTCIVIAIAIWTPWPIWYFIAARVAFGIAFSIAYRTVSR